jgi:ubiquinone/menaquinone biosynthesis C-methylase UbiE
VEVHGANVASLWHHVNAIVCHDDAKIAGDRPGAEARPMATDPTYTHGHHESVLRAHRWRTAANSAGYLLPHLRPGLSLLDVGCGPGTITVDLATAVAPGSTVGIDNAPAALEAARALDAGPTVHFELGDVTQLPFPDRSFDVVHAHQVLQHLPDPVGALREMARVARPGGLVAARDSDYAAMTWFPADPDLDDWLATYRTVARANAGEPDAGRMLVHWGQQAGFDEIEASASVWCFAHADDRAWWGGLWSERVTESTLAERAVSLGLASPTDLERMAAAWRRWVGAPDGWFAVLHGEILCRVPERPR